jgi:hypothetical protein
MSLGDCSRFGSQHTLRAEGRWRDWRCKQSAFWIQRVQRRRTLSRQCANGIECRSVIEVYHVLLIRLRTYQLRHLDTLRLRRRNCLFVRVRLLRCGSGRLLPPWRPLRFDPIKPDLDPLEPVTPNRRLDTLGYRLGFSPYQTNPVPDISFTQPVIRTSLGQRKSN